MSELHRAADARRDDVEPDQRRLQRAARVGGDRRGVGSRARAEPLRWLALAGVAGSIGCGAPTGEGGAVLGPSAPSNVQLEPGRAAGTTGSVLVEFEPAIDGIILDRPFTLRVGEASHPNVLPSTPWRVDAVLAGASTRVRAEGGSYASTTELVQVLPGHTTRARLRLLPLAQFPLATTQTDAAGARTVFELRLQEGGPVTLLMWRGPTVLHRRVFERGVDAFTLSEGIRQEWGAFGTRREPDDPTQSELFVTFGERTAPIHAIDTLQRLTLPTRDPEGPLVFAVRFARPPVRHGDTKLGAELEALASAPSSRSTGGASEQGAERVFEACERSRCSAATLRGAWARRAVTLAVRDQSQEAAVAFAWGRAMGRTMRIKDGASTAVFESEIASARTPWIPSDLPAAALAAYQASRERVIPTLRVEPAKNPQPGGLPHLVRGRLKVDDVQKAVAERYVGLLHCHALHGAIEHSLVTTTFVIGRDGVVGEVQSVRSVPSNPGLEACLASQLAQVRAPEPEGGIVTAAYELELGSAVPR